MYKNILILYLQAFKNISHYHSMTLLSVNVNKIATLRNARGGNLPDLLSAVKKIMDYGAEGITVHPRPDQRHITYGDVIGISKICHEFNVEGYPSQAFIKLVLSIQPQQCTLVPDDANVITSNQGWNIDKHKSLLKATIQSLKEKNIRVSLFIDPTIKSVQGAKQLGADRVELYTGPYAQGYEDNRQTAIQNYIDAAQHAQKIGLEMNAGHDLSLDNLGYFINKIAIIKEVSIGHALICQALYWGLEKTIRRYLDILKKK